jgi:hypothetical protein
LNTYTGIKYTVTITGEAGGVFSAEYRTFRAVFPAVAVFPRHDPAGGDAGSPAWWGRARNIFLAATLGEPRTKAALVAEAQRLWGDLAGTRLLTDDFAPVDTLAFEVSPAESGVP